MRLIIDEMYPRLIAQELRVRGHDAVSVHDAPGRGTLDEDLFAFALREARAIVTENARDFRPLAAQHIARGVTHFGLVLASPKRWSGRNLGALIAALDSLLRARPDQPTNEELWLRGP